MKKFMFCMLLILLIIPSEIHASNKLYNSQINQPNQQDLYRESMLSLLYPYISSEIDKYYGYPKQFDLSGAKIISIQRPSEKFEFTIVIQVETFTGPHNPPYGIETLTIKTSVYGTEVIKFDHKSE